MIEAAVITVIVGASVAYWMRHLVPASGPLFWRSTASVLQVVRAPASVRSRAERRAEVIARPSGCGACKACNTGKCH